MVDRKFYVAAKGAIFNNDKFLIVKRSIQASSECGFWEML